MVWLPYCDGTSFAGNVDHQVNGLYFRGHQILLESLAQLKAQGLAKAKYVLVSGSSAGGLATYLHADTVTAVLPNAVVKALPDAGYFNDMTDVNDVWHIQNQFRGLYTLANVSSGIPVDCAASFGGGDKAWPCFFAPHVYPFIKTPTFVANSLEDIWQLLFILAPLCMH